jgi:hypothetical protein
VPTGAPTSTSIPDPCPYRNVNSIHPGVDYFNQDISGVIIPSRVIALCDGVIVPGRNLESGGSANPSTGAGLSLRCFANDPVDPDGDGLQNLSNIVVVYNHLVLDQGISSSQVGQPYQVVQAGSPLATTSGYNFRGRFVSPHLDLQIYLAYNYRSGQGIGSVQLNPRLMFVFPQSRQENDAGYALNYGSWSLKGRQEANGTGRIHFWTNPHTSVFIEDIVGYIESTILPPGYRYIGPNCVNITVGLDFPTTCIVDDDDLLDTDVPIPQSEG